MPSCNTKLGNATREVRKLSLELFIVFDFVLTTFAERISFHRLNVLHQKLADAELSAGAAMLTLPVPPIKIEWNEKTSSAG
jgi:hypothetical protein